MADTANDGRILYETWTLLLNGWGFNWYRLDNQLQADDLLVRNRVCADLAAAGARLRDIEAAFRQRHLPPPTRAIPLPDATRLREAQAIARLRERIAATETQVRGSAMPPNDRIWSPHRDHTQTLAALLEADTRLVGAAHDMAACAAAQPDDFTDLDATLARCEALRGMLDTALAARRASLEIGVAG
jgi:hypothetical protein